MEISQLIKAAAIVMWADEQLMPEEIDQLKVVLKKYHFDETLGIKLLNSELEKMLDLSEDDEEDSDEPWHFGVIDIGATDPFELLGDLCQLACRDGSLDWNEIEVLHELAKSMNLHPIIVSAVLCEQVANGTVNVNLNRGIV